MFGLRYIEPVVTLRLDDSVCTGCGQCARVCPHGVFQVVDGVARIVDLGACMECGACSLNCAAGAISLKPGVGCAAAIINGWVRGTEPSCDCAGDGCC